jgi:hypothetical protein
LSRRSPGAIAPLRIASSNCRATWLYRGTGLERSSCGSIVANYVPPSVEPRWTTRSSAALILAASITSITAIAWAGVTGIAAPSRTARANAR